MTPSNPSSGNPYVIEILDSNNVKHQVAPVNHTHSTSEVVGLETALSRLGYEILKSEGYQTAIVRCRMNSGNAQILLSLTDFAQTEGDRKAIITWQNMPNIQRALLDPDSAPTASSDKLVTSGGVKTALDGKANSSHTHTVSQITDFNSEVHSRVLAGIQEAIRGVDVKNVKVSSSTPFDIDETLAGGTMKNRQTLALVTNEDNDGDLMSAYIVSGGGVDIYFNDDNKKLENGMVYLISIIYSEYIDPQGSYFVSVVSEFTL